jgi:hypothetical protein
MIDRSWASITSVDTQLNAIKIHTTTPVYQKNASIMDQPPKFNSVILERTANGRQCHYALRSGTACAPTGSLKVTDRPEQRSALLISSDMKYRDIEYTVVQGIGHQLWKWSVSFDTGLSVRGQAAIKSEAVAEAERAIDRALAPNKDAMLVLTEEVLKSGRTPAIAETAQLLE